MGDVLSALDLIAALLFGTAVGMITLTSKEIRAAKTIVWIAATLFIVRWGCWALVSDQPWLIKAIVGAIIGAFAFGALPPALKWITDKLEQPTSQETTAEPVKEIAGHRKALSEHVIRELENLDDFIGKKDEIELRDLFDFPKIIEYNIRFYRREVFPSDVTPQESAEIDKFFSGGNAIVDVRFVNIRNVNNRADIQKIPGKIGIINVSSKYTKSNRALSEFAASPKIPREISDTISKLIETIQNNQSQIFDVINEKFSDNKQCLKLEFEPTSVYFGSIEGMYWKRFIDLRPKVDQINSYARNYFVH